jgi:hypothetical protein
MANTQVASQNYEARDSIHGGQIRLLKRAILLKEERMLHLYKGDGAHRNKMKFCSHSEIDVDI